MEWGTVLFLAAALAIGVFAYTRARAHRREEAARSRHQLGVYEHSLRGIDAKLAQLAQERAYLTTPQARELIHETESALREIDTPRSRRGARWAGAEAVAKLAKMRPRLLALRDELTAGYNDRHVSAERERYCDILSRRMKLNDEQQLAAVRDDVANLVIAGAGSGKTRVMTARIMYLLARGVPPGRVLAVTFTNKARDEMKERLEANDVVIAADGHGVTVSTLHALGKRIIIAATGAAPGVAADGWQTSQIRATLLEASSGKDSRLAAMYREVLIHFFRSEREDDEASKTAFQYRTLSGAHVRSIGERIIADFLFVNQVPFKYEATATWANNGRGGYQPDFFLPNHGVYIEHWGVDEHGCVPSWFTRTSEQYRAEMEWKRDQFKQSPYRLVETYDHERRSRTLEAALAERLRRAGVELRPLSVEQLKERVRALRNVDHDLVRLYDAFVTNARAQRLTLEEIRQRFGHHSPRVRSFGVLGIEMLARHEQALRAERKIDFSDMLHHAADALESGRLGEDFQYDHILVDEFQDTSAPMARLIRTLRAHGGAKLFAVGDDWQAIYAFAGGDVTYIVDFQKHFGDVTISHLDTNYRCPGRAIEAGAALLEQNTNQLQKRVRAQKPTTKEPVVHTVEPTNESVLAKAVEIVKTELASGRRAHEIMVLARTNHMLDELEQLLRRESIRIQMQTDQGEKGVRLLTAHRAKGTEAPCVVVMDASDDIFGFPSKVEDPDVLEPVRMTEGNDLAEERRVLYVALTRTKEALHIITRDGLPSPFLLEIEGVPAAANPADVGAVPIGSTFSGVFRVERLLALTDAQREKGAAQCGVLVSAASRARFISWTRDGAPMLEAGRTYRLEGLLRDHDYAGAQQVRLTGATTAVETTPLEAGLGEGVGTRALRVRPRSASA